MPKTYDFESTEDRLYAWWEAQGYFKPEIAGPDAEPYVISMPPPNVTGALHQGHALFVALEDLDDPTRPDAGQGCAVGSGDGSCGYRDTATS